MKKDIKIYTIYAFTIYSVDFTSKGSYLNYITGTFSNLKNLYSHLEGDKLHSYSYINKQLKKELTYSAKEVKIKIENQKICN